MFFQKRRQGSNRAAKWCARYRGMNELHMHGFDHIIWWSGVDMVYVESAGIKTEECS
jgi:hypothetical protein